MTVNLSIKNVPESLAELLRRRAEANHRSLQGELMALLESAMMTAHVAQEPGAYIVPGNAGVQAKAAAMSAAKPSAAWAGEPRTLRQIWEDARVKYRGDTTSSVELLREAREERDMRDMQPANVVDAAGAHARAKALLDAVPRRSATAARNRQSKSTATKKSKRA